jgi:hypothetical protein
VEYLDTGGRDPAKTLHAWLSSKLPGATYFGCQSGYFTADALYAFGSQIRAILDGGGEVRLVLGANEDELSAADLNDALDLLEPYGAQASITIVSAVDVLVHPKTFYVERAGGELEALVGSANLTGSGLGANIEACLSISSTTEPAAPFAEIKAAIEAWLYGHANAMLLDRDLVPRLAAAAVIDRPRRSRVQSRRSLRRLFPPLGRVLPVPRRAQRPRPAPASGTTPALTLVPGSAFPPGVVGVVKRLSALDTKGFRGGRGTLYIAMPRDLLPLLPTTPAGRNSEPRVDVTVEARHASAPGMTVSSGANPTNITGVGYGTRRTSHRDVRFNILRVIVSGIEYIAANASVAVPAAGDFLAVEFEAGGRATRLTFVVDGPLKSQLSATCGSDSWAWLRGGTVPPW